MSRSSVWKRLLWKEYREGRWVVLIALAAPALCFPMAARYDFDSWQRGLFALPGAAGVHLAIALWAAGRGAGKREGSEFARSHLPVNAFAEWAASFLVPVLVTGALGWWFGFWSGKVVQSYRAVSTTQAGAVDLMTTYAICYLMSAIISSWAAIMFAAFRVAAGTLINVWNLSPMTEADVVGFVGRTMLGALAGSLVFTALVQKKSLAFRQAVSLLLMLVIVFAPAIGNLDVSFLIPKPGDYSYYGGSLLSDAMAVSAYERGASRDHMLFRCVNHRADTMFERGFPARSRLVDIVGERWVYLISQASSHGPVRVLEWDSVTNQVRDRARVPWQAIKIDYSSFKHVSPDRRHMLIVLESTIGSEFMDSEDLWLVDLQSGRSEIVLPCQDELHIEEAVFLRDRAIITRSRQLVIDYRTFRATPLCIQRGDLR